jgi:hypothetical protein
MRTTTRGLLGSEGVEHAQKVTSEPSVVKLVKNKKDRHFAATFRCNRALHCDAIQRGRRRAFRRAVRLSHADSTIRRSMRATHMRII